MGLGHPLRADHRVLDGAGKAGLKISFACENG